MAISTEAVKELREKTGAGIMDCKRALEEADGNFDKAVDVLRERGLAAAKKKEARVASQGLVEAYIHAGGRIGVIVEVNCETDFVARTDEFKQLAHDIAMQVAATDPQAISPEELSADSPAAPEEAALLRQPFIRDPSRTMQEIITEAIAKVGENIRVRRFARFELGR